MNPASQDDKLLIQRINDGINCAEKRCKPFFMGFLDERETALAQTELAKNRYTNYLFFGGYENAARAFVGIFPDFLSPESEMFPVFAVTFTFRCEDKLTHRDFLGALMSLMITRESIGDILVDEGIAVAFLTESGSKLALNEITKIGRVGVKVSGGAPDPLPICEKFEEISGTVASERLDSVVALITKQSREKASQIIKQGLVSTDFSVNENCSHNLTAGTKISVRGCGRFIYDGAKSQTKKGRLFINVRKYI